MPRILSGIITLGNLKLNIDWHSVTICISLVLNNFIENESVNWEIIKNSIIFNVPKSPCTFAMQEKRSQIGSMTTHPVCRLLIPLFVLSGFQQGFVFADYTKVTTYIAFAEIPPTS